MNTTRYACVLGIAIAASTLHAQTITDSFDNYQVGSFPGGDWQDIEDRTVGSPADSPTMLVIETIDAHGNPTRAVQTNQEPGTNGFYLNVPTDVTTHRVTMDVRVDSMHSANAGWPVSVGYSRYLGQDDVNANPQGLIYVWTGRVWNLFITAGGGRPAIDERLSGPQLILGRWYTLSLEVDVEAGRFIAQVFDKETGVLRNSLTHTYTQWNPGIDSYNSITVFDGGDTGSPLQGQATIDNVEYTSTAAEPCIADFLADGTLNFQDISAYILAFTNQDPSSDLTNDGSWNFLDISAFLSAYNAGCP
jgi:hypothetical protein